MTCLWDNGVVKGATAILLVIFGAGASYGSVDLESAGVTDYHLRQYAYSEIRPPLASGLFENRTLFNDAANEYSQISGIAGDVRHGINKGQDIEEMLQVFQERAENEPRFKIQLAALRYYLLTIISGTEEGWLDRFGHITNYARLVSSLETWRASGGGAVAYVTFNYDTMLESALRSTQVLTVSEMDTYVSDPSTKVFKPHGSINWALRGEGLANMYPERDPKLLRAEIVNGYSSLKLEVEPELYDQVLTRPVISEGISMVPAITIPQSKKDLVHFTFPESHLDNLRRVLPDVTRVLVVGWRGQENHFLNEWREHFTMPIKTLIVSSTQDDGQQTQGNLMRVGLNMNVSIYNTADSFTDVIGSDELREFLA